MGEAVLPAGPDAEAVELSTLPAGLADLAGLPFPDTLGILLPINPLFSETLRPPINDGKPEPEVTLGIRFPTRPRPADEDGRFGPAVPNAWVGRRGAAEGLLNLAMRSLSEPETARWVGPDEGEFARELDAGGVRVLLGASDLQSAKDDN
jgi:hypothetical protein